MRQTSAVAVFGEGRPARRLTSLVTAAAVSENPTVLDDGEVVGSGVTTGP